ncbi:hypothetical protein D9M72_560410 [compost metagenome]
MGVEVQHGHRFTGALGGGPQQRQRNGVVPAEGDQLAAACGQVEGILLDGFDGLIDVERVDGHVSGVRDLDVLEGTDVPRGVVGAQQPAGLTDMVGAEAGTRAVGDAGIEGHSHHRDVRLGHLVQPGQAGVGCGPCITGNTG